MMMLDASTLAAQLRQPHGDAALAVADSMNRSNGALNRAAIGLLAVTTGEQVLEIGPGNAAFAPHLLQAAGSRYLGIEWSTAMVEAGNQRLAGSGLAGRAVMRHGDAHALPVADASMDAALAVNTLYFWPNLAPVLDELARVLRRAGRLCLAFGDAAFMRSLPFAADFQLHELDAVELALRVSGFRVSAWRSHRETAVGNDGQTREKHFHLLLAHRR
ncbi:class I SAM-dependent methyltransferase [Stenotrophomonas maltophilia]|uniref:class I SAM-dependent methyltransferase n=1 Tax=Stenotrophomonas sp. RAC2 TaxID=3064902 RepID=UPI0018D4B83D|nr:class I SAM-dependent methyltransferase [Stenotrophomonas sp. RAC2]MBH1434095.1 class I SAM-dependent methyltransferase [Stenotrophomonas maltophilia]MDV9042444.1 class I SAM-dependent methyltransferase [Stenotrophomonas sp. RAC2]